MLTRSNVNADVASGAKYSKHRLSEQYWIDETESKATLTITQRIQNFLDVSLFSDEVGSEMYQIANYGSAGQYNVHWDQLLMDPASPGYEMAKRHHLSAHLGDRLATVG